MQDNVHYEDLVNFLLRSNQLVTSDKVEPQSEKDDTVSVFNKEDKWLYHYNYTLGEPMSGRTLIFYKNKPFFFMGYYGWVDKEYTNVNQIITFLKESIQNATVDMPFRGPSSYRRGDFYYRNNIKGDAESFSGEERVYIMGQEIYRGMYFGGVINQR